MLRLIIHFPPRPRQFALKCSGGIVFEFGLVPECYDLVEESDDLQGAREYACERGIFKPFTTPWGDGTCAYSYNMAGTNLVEGEGAYACLNFQA